MTDDAVLAQMEAQIGRWEQASDQRVIFLRCYLMMTRNMRAAIGQGEFHDPDWVGQLLENFAGYYFIALETYEQNSSSAPLVWQQAHQGARDPGSLALQNLLLGVNAHINYDLVLSLVELLEPEWAGLSKEQRSARYADHCHVNEVIGCTIDAVQDQVLEPAMPVMVVIDRLLGPLDERLISAMLSHWRENVWQNAVRMLETNNSEERQHLLQEVEQEAIQMGKMIQNTRTNHGRSK